MKNSSIATFLLAVIYALGASSAFAGDFSEIGPRSAQVDLAAYETVRYVDPLAGDDVHGLGTKESPWRSVTHALEHTGHATRNAPVAVLVSQGTFLEPTFALRPHVALYGGFEKPDGKRDVYAYPTILDGGFRQRILFGANDARLDGFHLVQGRVRGKGAAIYCDGVSPEIVNCVLEDNRTLIPQPWNPKLLHETANDGGAIMVLNGAAPLIENNYFYNNTTECGRGGAIGIDLAGAPLIRGNVFANNRTGLDDPFRSSDGGAVSFFDWARGEFVGNVLVANEALSSNDAGGLFVALWSSPLVADNVIVSNEGGDDAGGLFVGGQEHRYDSPLDEYPNSDDYTVRVYRNLIVGNTNTSRNSGAMRITMESRVDFADNIVTENTGGMYLQRSEMNVRNNTVWQDWKFVEDKASLGPSVFTGNILKGPAGAMELRATFEGNMMDADVPDSKKRKVEDVFVQDGVQGEIVSSRFDAATNSTVLEVSERIRSNNELAGRAVRIGKSPGNGQWRVIKSAQGKQLVVWGMLKSTTSDNTSFDILRSFTLSKSAPKGIGAGSEMGR